MSCIPKSRRLFFLVSFVQPLFYSILSTCFLSSFVFIHCLVGLFVCGVVPFAQKKVGVPLSCPGMCGPLSFPVIVQSKMDRARRCKEKRKPAPTTRTRENEKKKRKKESADCWRPHGSLVHRLVWIFFHLFYFLFFFLIFLSFLAGLAVAPGRAPGRVCQRTSLLPQKDRSKEKAKRRPITGKKERGLNHTKEHSTARLDRVLLRKKKRKK